MSDWWLHTDIPQDPDIPPPRSMMEILRDFASKFSDLSESLYKINRFSTIPPPKLSGPTFVYHTTDEDKDFYNKFLRPMTVSYDYKIGVETRFTPRVLPKFKGYALEDTCKEYPTSCEPWPATRKLQTQVTLGKRRLRKRHH